MSVNKVILIGNLGSDPETHSFSNGGMVANVSLATTEKWSDKQTGERKEMTEWHRLVFNNRLAEIAQQYLRKGSKIYVEGGIRTKKWQDQNGQDRYSTEIRVQQMQMLDSNPNAGQYQAGGSQSQGGVFQGQQQNQSSYQNQNQNQVHNQNQRFQDQGQQANGFGNPAPQQQAPQNNSAPQQAPHHQAPVNPTAPAMSAAPADDDIPF